MKVESHRAYLTPADLGRTEDVKPDKASSSRQTSTGAASDSVSLSSDAKLAQAAQQAAAGASSIRPDKVAQAKALLAEGKVGTDLDSLASSILDSLTKP
jgi:flagellar biosynthesis anti-sigma factor FlgM